MNLKNRKTLRKTLRKSPASDAWAAIFKNADFSLSFLKVTKLSKLLGFFSNLKCFCVSIFKKMISIDSVKPN